MSSHTSPDTVTTLLSTHIHLASVGEIMSKPVVTVNSNSSVIEVVRLMDEYGVDSIVVEDRAQRVRQLIEALKTLL